MFSIGCKLYRFNQPVIYRFDIKINIGGMGKKCQGNGERKSILKCVFIYGIILTLIADDLAFREFCEIYAQLLS